MAELIIIGFCLDPLVQIQVVVPKLDLISLHEDAITIRSKRLVKVYRPVDAASAEAILAAPAPARRSSTIEIDLLANYLRAPMETIFVRSKM